MKSNGNRIRAFIVASNLELFGKYSWAYGLLVRIDDFEGWHWGVKNFEDQWVDMQMFGLRRLLLAMANHDPDCNWRADIITPAAYLEQRLGMAAKWKRDMDRGLAVPAHRNREAWIETSTLWDMYRGGLREGISNEEMASLSTLQNYLNKLQYSRPSPLRTHEPYRDSPDELVLPT